MEIKEMNAIRKWFDSYVATFYSQCGKLHQLELKERHSHRVSSNAGLIADSLHWNEQDRNLAVICALLHDLGRFPQYRDYETFYDFKSVDHGERGLTVLNEDIPVDLISPCDLAIIKDCVQHHNKKEIPQGISSRSLPFLRIVRDSDKIDIFKVVQDHFKRDDTDSIYPGLQPEGVFTDEILAELMENGKAQYENIRTLSDVLIFQLCWVHDMEFDPSITLLWDRGEIEWIIDRLPKNPVASEILDRAMTRIERAKSLCR